MASKKGKHEETRQVIQRSNRPITPLLNMLMVQPQEFARRIRENLAAGRSPRRLLKCVDDVELALRHRGIKMPAYFAAIRRAAARAADGDLRKRS